MYWRPCFIISRGWGIVDLGDWVVWGLGFEGLRVWGFDRFQRFAMFAGFEGLKL